MTLSYAIREEIGPFHVLQRDTEEIGWNAENDRHQKDCKIESGVYDMITRMQL